MPTPKQMESCPLRLPLAGTRRQRSRRGQPRAQTILAFHLPPIIREVAPNIARSLRKQNRSGGARP
jgi:hypothetical protein